MCWSSQGLGSEGVRAPGGLYRGPGRAGGGQAAGEGGLTHPDSPSLPPFSIQTEPAASQGARRLARRRARNEKLEKLKGKGGGGRRGAGEVIGVPSLHLLGPAAAAAAGADTRGSRAGARLAAGGGPAGPEQAEGWGAGGEG